MHGVVGVDVVGILGVMPMVKLRGGEDVTEGTEVDPEIGVNRDRLHPDQDDVGIEGRLGEAANIERNHDHRARDEDFHEMGARPREPIHGVARVVNGMELPKHDRLVMCAVGPVLEEIGEEDCDQELPPDRDGTDKRLQAQRIGG